MAYTKNFDFLICDLESVSGTEETLLQADRNICVVGNTITASVDVAVDDEGSKCANGEHGENESITGTQMAEIAFSVKYKWSGTATTEPNLAKLLKACGLKESTLDNGVGYEPLLEYDIKTMTFWLYQREGGTASQYKKCAFAGGMGNMTVSTDGTGKPIMLNFTFKAKKLAETDETTVPAAGTFNTALPEKFLNAYFSYGSVASKKISTFTFDIGNDIQPEYDQSEATGIKYFRVVNRQPRFSFNPLMARVATQDIYSYYKDGTEATIKVSLPIDNPHFTLEIPVTQIISNGYADREGLHAHDLNMKCEKNGTVDTNLNAESTFRLIHGFENFVFRFGSSGTGNGQFQNPFGIATDTNDCVYIVDISRDDVQMFNSSGVFQFSFGENGTGDGQFQSPYGIATDSNNNVYVVDALNHNVQKFNSSGVFQLKFGTDGSGDGQFLDPYGIAIDSSDNIYITDHGRDDVQKFNSSGVFQLKFGTTGTGDGEFQNPRGIAINSGDNVFVTDISRDDVQKFNSSGVFQTKFGTTGTGDGEFQDPYGIAIGELDYIYVSDVTRCDVQKFNSSGVFQSKFGSVGDNDGQFQDPYGIASDSNGFLYMTDVTRDDVQKFKF